MNLVCSFTLWLLAVAPGNALRVRPSEDANDLRTHNDEASSGDEATKRSLLNSRHDQPFVERELARAQYRAQRRALVEESKEKWRGHPDHQIYFNHFPKAGGTFIKKALFKSIVEENATLTVDKEWDTMHTDAQQKFTMGTIRNPYEYYLSLWSWTSDPEGNGLKFGFSDEQKEETFGKIKPYGSTAEDRERFKKWLKLTTSPTLGTMSLRFYGSYLKGVSFDYAFPSNFTNITVNHPTVNHDIINSNFNLFQKETLPVKCWVHTEDAESEARKCLQEFETKCGPGCINWTRWDSMMASGTHNPSDHEKCSIMYDAEAKKLVQDADKHIFRLFNYPNECVN